MHPSSIFHLPNDLFFEIPTGNIIQTNKNTLFLLGFPPEVGMRKNRQLPTIKSNRNLKQTPEKKVADIDLSRKDQQQKASSFPCSPQKKQPWNVVCKNAWSLLSSSILGCHMALASTQHPRLHRVLLVPNPVVKVIKTHTHPSRLSQPLIFLGKK